MSDCVSSPDQEFYGSKVTFDAGSLANQERDAALRRTDLGENLRLWIEQE